LGIDGAFAKVVSFGPNRALSMDEKCTATRGQEGGMYLGYVQ